MNLPDIPLCILDTETTGFLPRVNRVIEFACVRVKRGEIVDRYEQLISIPGGVPATVQVLTRIREDDLKGQPAMNDVRGDILAHIGTDAMIVGQNVGFDLRMLKGEGIDLTDRPWIDTSMIASLVFPELASYSLGYVSKTLGLDHTPVHRAMGDVRATLQLLERCWERLCELPEDLRALTLQIMQRGSPGYRALFGALPRGKKTSAPGWLAFAQRKAPPAALRATPLPLPDRGTVHLIEESLDPDVLDGIVAAASADASVRHWIAVKNLDATVRRIRIPEGVRVLVSPRRMLDRDAVPSFAAQPQYTADEATLAVKIAWYEPSSFDDLPIHGDERAVWNGKLACTERSAAYIEQFKNLPSVVLIDHRQLLEFAADAGQGAHGALRPDDHVVIDDASMLEDTATKAYGWYCDLDALRAAAEGDAPLTGFLDALQIWVERTRAFRDIHFLTLADLTDKEAGNLRATAADLLRGADLPQLPRTHLLDLQEILKPENLPHRIVWIEQRQNGSQFLQSAPETVGPALRQRLYDPFRVTLLIPPAGGASMGEILPPGTPSGVREIAMASRAVNVAYPEECGLPMLLEHPPPGKTVVLAGSKRLIEEAFVAHAERLEERRVTLICQNLSGGQERMQAEFIAAPEPAVWLLTPWTYETAELPPGTIDRLIICSLPFDHPSHPVTGRRADRYRSGFAEYTLPRTMHRLFRLFRTAVRHAKPELTIEVYDERIRTKEYGKTIRAYLAGFAGTAQTVPPSVPPARASDRGPSDERKQPLRKKASKESTPPEGQMRLW